MKLPPLLTFEDFEPLIGEEFGLALENKDIALPNLTLSEATRIGTSSGIAREPFSLLFYGPTDHRLPQGTYDFCSPALSTQSIFIVPIAEDSEKRVYQAIFN